MSRWSGSWLSRWWLTWWSLVGGVLLAIGVGVLTQSLTVMTSGPLMAWFLHRELRRRDRWEQERQSEDNLVRLVDELIVGLRSGGSLRQGLETVGLVSSGGQLNEGPVELDRGVTSERLVLVTVGVLDRHGGSAVSALQRLRHTLIGRVNGRRQAEVAAGQAVASAGLLLAAPGLFVAMVMMVDRTMAWFYLRDPFGAVCIFLSVVLSGVGWWWIGRAMAAAVEEAA